MVTMNVSLPANLKEWVESRSRHGLYANASDYVRDLIRQDRERQEAISELRAMIQEGIDSGISPHSFDEILSRARAEAERMERA